MLSVAKCRCEGRREVEGRRSGVEFRRHRLNMSLEMFVFIFCVITLLIALNIHLKKNAVVFVLLFIKI